MEKRLLEKKVNLLLKKNIALLKYGQIMHTANLSISEVAHDYYDLSDINTNIREE
jgi:hypothetical protein